MGAAHTFAARVPKCAPRYAAAIAALAALVCLALPAEAHESDSRTRIVFQIGLDGAAAVVLHEVPAGTDAATVRSSADLDRDGALGEEEQTRLARELTREALGGVEVFRDDEALELDELEYGLELQPGRDGAVLLALMLNFEGGPGRYRIETAAAHPGLVLEFEAGIGLRLVAGTAALAEDRISAGPWRVANGDAVWVDVEPDVP